MSGLSIFGAAEVLTPPEPGLAYLRHDRAGALGLAPGSVATREGLIAALDDDPGAAVRVDASGCTLLPGLVDCHTHLPFAGWRAGEYEQKVTGVPYEQIARDGGGIASSARAFATESDERVLARAGTLADEMLRHGTTTFECKTGYGLSIEGEARALALAGRLADSVAAGVVRTALLAHAVPPGYGAGEWIDEVAAALPGLLAGAGPSSGAAGAAGVRRRAPASPGAPVVALDIFVESVAFGLDDLARIGALAAEHGLALRAHVEQLSTMRSVRPALDAGARSLDHLARLHADDLAPLAGAECAAVLLPGAELLGAEAVAPGRALADAGAICVLATDCNPGTSPVHSLPLVIGIAVRRYGWSAREAALAVTLNAAWVLGRSEPAQAGGDAGGSGAPASAAPPIGAIEPGRVADLVLLDGPLDHVAYRFGRNPVCLVVRGGEVAWVLPGHEWRVRA